MPHFFPFVPVKRKKKDLQFRGEKKRKNYAGRDNPPSIIKGGDCTAPHQFK